MSGKQRNDAAKQLDWAKTTLGAADIEAPTVPVAGDVGCVIARYAKDLDIDGLIMGAYVHSPLRSLLFGSRTSDLLRSVKITTLLLR
jgi:nucleotide-binding universal stress UspA family protein